jgi:uncharacterized protein YqeY
MAMKAKDAVALSALRSVLSALDNASAVSVTTVAAPYSEEYARIGRSDEAARLRAEQSIIERYVRGAA